MRLENKTIIITGSTTGIGRAMATRFVAEGAQVLVHGRDQERGETLCADLGDQAAFATGDLADPAVPQQLVDATLKTFGKLDAVVNNAATVQRANIETVDADLFDWFFAINARAPMLLIKAALPHLKTARGAVLNIGSMNAYTGEANLLPYSMTKGALMTMSRNLADSLGSDHVRVTHLNVGWVLTENEYKQKIADGLDKDWPEHVPKVYAPSGKLMVPENIASAAVYWVSDESRPISGSVIDLAQYPLIGRNPVKED